MAAVSDKVTEYIELMQDRVHELEMSNDELKKRVKRLEKYVDRITALKFKLGFGKPNSLMIQNLTLISRHFQNTSARNSWPLR